MRIYDPSGPSKSTTPRFPSRAPRDPSDAISQSTKLNTHIPLNFNSANMSHRELSSKPSSSKLSSSRTLPHRELEKEPSSRATSGENQLHSSAAAPRQSEAFKRLGQASLVSSSIFKSAPSTPNQTSRATTSRQPSNDAQTGSQFTPGSRISFTPQRAPGTQSQMAAALQGLGIASQVLSPTDSHRPLPSTRPLSTFTHSTQGTCKPGTKRKSDENLPVPPRPPPNLPPSAPPLQVINQISQKARPPRQSNAYNLLTRNALVTSSPFKASRSDLPTNKSALTSSEAPDSHPSSSPSTSFTPSSEADEVSSHESDLVHGSPSPNTWSDQHARPTPMRPSGSTNGVLKMHRLGGPRSLTPPHHSQSSGYISEPDHCDATGHAPSALSGPSRRHERRKTVTWGGEDVLEFEWEEEWRRASNTSSSDSASQPSDSKPEDISDVSSELDPSDHPQGPSDPSIPEHPSRSSEHWQGRSDTREINDLTHQTSDERDRSPHEEDDDMINNSQGSVVIHDDLEDPALPVMSGNDISCTAYNHSSEIDPVDQMVDALLTSPDLAGLVSAQAGQPWSATTIVHAQDRNLQSENEVASDGLESITTQETEEAAKEPNRVVAEDGYPKSRSRFPYIQVEKPKPPSEAQDSALAPDALSSSNDGPLDQSSLGPAAPFQPLSLSSLGLDDSTFGEASMISSILETSTLDVEGLDTMSLAASQPMLSSTPRASYTDQLPTPNPHSPQICDAVPVSQVEVEQPPSAHTSPRRPLPRPPSVSPSAHPEHAALQALSAPSSSAYNLPEVPHSSPFPSSSQLSGAATTWVRPVAESMTSESDTGCESGPGSPGGTRPRITRKKIHDRIRDRDRAMKSGDESGDLSLSILSREATSHSASIHKLGLNGEEEKLDLSQDITMDSDEPSRSTVTLGPLKEIQARPPMRAQQVQLPNNDDSIGNRETQLEQGNLSTIASGLDKLARGFQAFEDGTKSCDSSVSLVGPDGPKPAEALPSKVVMLKGAGRRRRSASTGGADLDETGTGAGAKAAVKSNPVMRHTMAVDKESSKITAALLHNTIQPAMAKTNLQEPLNQVLNQLNNAKSYRVSEPDEIVVASDHTVTAGVAGDVAANRNWRKLRKVSDINQHAAQLKTFWAQNDNANKIGRVFIKLSKLVFRGLPLSQPPAHFQVVIDNGLHNVRTPFYKLEPDVTIGVEFELIRAKKLEFTLSFCVPLNEPMNAHLKPPVPPQPLSPPRPISQAPPPPIPHSPKRLFGFLGPSKKSSKQIIQGKQQQIQAMEREKAALARQLASRPHPLVGLLDRNHIIATAKVNFEQYAQESLGQWKHVVVSCMSAIEDPIKAEMQMRRTFSGPVGQVSLECLSLPPIPKLPNATIPNSGSECLKGLKIAEWWQEVWHEGVLSQLGADCPTWRRRTFKATGGSLFAYNDIMKKLSAEIRLTEVVSLQDCGSADIDENEQPKAKHSAINEQGEILPPFTFRLVFKDGSEILFHADNQTEFKRWKNVLKQLLGKIQPLPAWAELLRLQIAARKASMADEQEREERQPSRKPAGNRQPGRRARSPNGRATASQLPSSSSQASSVSTLTSGTSCSHTTNLSDVTSNTYTSFRPASSLTASQVPSHRLTFPAAAGSDCSSSRYRPPSTLISSPRPTLSAMSSTGSTTSTAVSRPAFSDSSTAANLPPVKSQMKRSKGPVKLV
ncbi:hypothetical protein PCANC_07386 [Puccinia coronata f. sp. avenae]|uniref:PH domain-containing protein n=1 Tax=Puccinia coronata f. sp. avenae TaxID=200324 RepID=A0A2N5T5D1_9BASI|nr:hypothetical protein PCANC_07386 [Puccinia coronata f. sp. avenae]